MSTKNTQAPDYMGLAQFMGQTGYDLGQSQTFANRPNINTPFGSIDWQYQPGTYTGPVMPEGYDSYGSGTAGGGANLGQSIDMGLGAAEEAVFGNQPSFPGRPAPGAIPSGGSASSGQIQGSPPPPGWWGPTPGLNPPDGQILTQGNGTTSQAPIPGAIPSGGSVSTGTVRAEPIDAALTVGETGDLPSDRPPRPMRPDGTVPPPPMTNEESGLEGGEVPGGVRPPTAEPAPAPIPGTAPGVEGGGEPIRPPGETGVDPNRPDVPRDPWTYGQWTQNVTLSPEQQAILESQQSLQQGTLGSALGMLGGGLSGQSAEEALYGKLTSRLDPRFEQQQNQLRTRLYNMGLREGDAAFDQQMQQFGQGRDDAYQQAAYQATLGGEQSLQNQINAINALAGRPVSQPSFPGFMGASGSQVPDYLGAALQGFNTNQLQQSQNLGGLASILGLFI